MPCPEVAELEMFASRALDKGVAASLEAHLSSCGDCRALYDDVRANLEMVGPIRAAFTGSAGARLDLSPPLTRVGDYTIIRELGRGGMGVVYEAEQSHPRRVVALKVLNSAYIGDARHGRLFQREIEALARLKHPCIAAIHDAGQSADGRDYYTMELVAGVTLREYARAHALPVRGRIELFRRVCEAVAYAHQRGVIHRDLKPSNVLVDAAGAVKVLDFGLAKLLDADGRASSVVTEIGRVQGTIPYMSPEQVRGTADEVDARSDVYALGVVLFELLTGQLPHLFKSASLPESARLICEQPPQKPSALNRALRGDLETILLKSLEKKPDDRYAGAAALSDDLARYLANDPISARPPTFFYQLRKLVARHRLAASFGAIVFALLLVVAPVMTLLYTDAEKQRRLANQHAELQKAETAKLLAVNGFLQTMLAAPGDKGHAVSVLDVLVEAVRQLDARSNEYPPTVESAVRYTIGRTYWRLGRIPEAEQQLRSALELSRAALGEEALETARAESGLAEVLLQTGKATDAEQLMSASLETFRSTLGPTHPETVAGLMGLVHVLMQQGQAERADPMLREFLGMLDRLPADNPDAALALTGLAAALHMRRHEAEAEMLYRRVCEMHHAAGRVNPRTANLALSNLGYLLNGRGEHAEAERYLREAVESSRANQPPDETARFLNSLVFSLRCQKKLEEAELAAREALALLAESVGTRHFRYLTALAELASVLMDCQRYAEAEPLYREALEIESELPQTRLSGGQRARLLSGLGEALTLQDRPAEGEALLRQALDFLTDKAPDPHRGPVTRHLLGLAVLAQHRFAEAESLIIGSAEFLLADKRLSMEMRRRAIQAAVTLYERWDADGPPVHAAEAQAWRARLAELDARPAP